MQKKEERIKEVEIKVEDKYIRWFSEIGKENVKEVGGKAANLGEMLKIGMPVPQGFVINAPGYLYFLEKTGLKEKIYEKLKDLNVEDTALLEKKAKEIRDIFVEAEMPSDLKEEILEAYNILSSPKDLKNISESALSILKMSEPAFVAVRSSATAEDSSIASFAGQQETFLNIKGNDAVIESVKKCFASLFTARSIYYRIKKGFKHEDVLNAVIIQIMINSDKSGVIFSRDPVTKDKNVIIEAVFGLGEGIVSGKIKPDYYVVSIDLEILKKKVANKKIAIVRTSSGEEKEVKLTEEKSREQVLSDYEIKRLADYALRLEQHYKAPQDIEFALESGEIYIVQTRPITTLEKEVGGKGVEGKEILSGQPASSGIGSGEVKIVSTLEDLSKIKEGDILVTKMTNPDMVVTMQKSSAIITDEGGMTAHAAIVSREMGIPCVVGTEKATQILKDGMIVTVDGFRGKVYEGKTEGLKVEKVEIKPIVETKTKIKVMVDLPSYAERASKTGCKEVGLVRIEGIIAESGKHPLYFLNEGKIHEYEEIIFSGLSKIAKYFDNLWVRTSDIRTDEFRNLEGSPKEIEANPMLGMHGIRAGLKYREILKAELKAISRLGEEGKEVGILLPQIISVSEVKKVKEILKEINAENLKLGVMIETPASVEIIEDLCKEGINFISFGTNDLTQYTLAIDRGNADVQSLYDEMHPAVLSQLEKVIRVCKKYGVETSICGQAGSKKEMAEFLVKLGIDSISVNADKAFEISSFVKELEDRGLRGVKLDKISSEEGEDEEQDKKEKNSEEETAEKENGGKVERDKFGRKLYTIRCDKCGKAAKVPFEPEEGREVYCKSCYNEIKKERKEMKKEKDLKDENINTEMEENSDDRKEEEKEEKKMVERREKGGRMAGFGIWHRCFFRSAAKRKGR